MRVSYNKSKLESFFKTIVEQTTTDGTTVDLNKSQILCGAGSLLEVVHADGRRFSGALESESGPTLYIQPLGRRAKVDFVNECIKDRELAMKVGSQAIFNRIDALIKALFKSSSDSLPKIDYASIVKQDILKYLRNEIQTWKVRVPIAKLNIKKEFHIGSVKFVPFQSGIVSNATMILNYQGPEGENVEPVKSSMLGLAAEIAATGSAWAETEVSSHASRIKFAAIDQIELAINSLRSFTHVFHGRTLKAAFGLPYEIVDGRTGFLSVSDKGFQIDWDQRGPLANFELSDEVLGRLNAEFEFEKLSQIAGADFESLNSLERAVQVSIRWLGRSIVAPTTTDAFTLCAITMERLLICDGESTTTETLSDRTAFLIGSSPDSRAAVHRAVKRLYDIRSKIVHAGYEGVEIPQLIEIENLALLTLREILKLSKTLTSHEDLKAMLLQTKFGLQDGVGKEK